MPEPRQHLTMSFGETNGVCRCGTTTLLITPFETWNADHNCNPPDSDTVAVDDEISAHFCPECQRVTSLSFNEGSHAE